MGSAGTPGDLSRVPVFNLQKHSLREVTGDSGNQLRKHSTFVPVPGSCAQPCSGLRQWGRGICVTGCPARNEMGRQDSSLVDQIDGPGSAPLPGLPLKHRYGRGRCGRSHVGAT